MSVKLVNSATFQNVEGGGTQTYKIVIDDDGNVSATANKSISGGKTAKVPVVTWNGQKWVGNGTGANKFLKNAKNLKNLNDRTEELINYANIDNAKFPGKKDNTASIGTQVGAQLGDILEEQNRSQINLSNIKADIPKDPEGFFIGRYPINQKDTSNFDFLKITCYDYEHGDFGKDTNLFKLTDIDKRIKKRRGVVSLPMQPGISEANSVGWGNDQLNPLQIAGASAAVNAMSTLGNAISGQGFDLSSLLQTTGGTLRAAASAIGEDTIKAYFAGQAIGANIIGRSTGLSINNNLEVLFNGPNLRSFSYNYRFTPREPKEADKIKQIIRFFKKQMAPKRSTSRIFLKSPNVFKLKYTYKNGDSHPFLNNIKICALNNFTVDYTPDGSYSTYEDDGGRGDGSMTSYQVGLGFMEMTPIYNDDFWNDDEGKEGTGF
jgi:hypothetical protein